MKKILLIDDNQEMGPLLSLGLRPYVVEQATSLAVAETALQNSRFDLLLIDVELPDGDGFEFCTRLLNDMRFQNIPKIMLTAKTQTSEIVYGLNCGADDYVTKPFSVVELKARIDGQLRRFGSDREVVFTFECFEFHLGFQKVYILEEQNKADLSLTPTEFRLLLMLAKNEGKVLTRKHLEREIWQNHGTVIEARGIDTHIAHIRKKLGLYKDWLVSVYGQGYSFQPVAVLAAVG